MKCIFYIIFLLIYWKSSFSQFGKNGTLTLSSGTTTVNQYAKLAFDIVAGQNTIVVDSISNLSINLTCGDLIMVYQAQGANIDASNTANYGTITNYNSSGLFEFRHVTTVSQNTITLNGPLTNAYSVVSKIQIIKVPQYTNLNVSSLATITSNAWNGNSGGVIVIHAKNSITLDGKINNTGKGFRAGLGRLNWGYSYNGLFYISGWDSDGGEKGEGIGGSQTDYDVLGGRFCRGAAANGGGGGTNHNAGGGGGANAINAQVYNGAGVMNNTSMAFTMDIDYINNSNNYTNSSGGGRGGNSYAETPQNPLVTPPGNLSWGGDNWRNVGGRGGKPLTNINYLNRIYFGGGGGAGDANNQSGGSGAKGGGIVILISPQIIGNGYVIANGDSAGSSFDDHSDALGGGGGGGSIIINALSLDNNINLIANGGKGGSMIAASSPFPGASGYVIGPGGGGGGGYISLPNTSSALTNINGGLHGKNYHASMSNFPEDGATMGGTGLVEATPSFTLISDIILTTSSIGILSVSSNSICAGQTAIITPSGATNYSLSTGSISNSNFIVTPTSNTTYTIYGLSSCVPTSTVITISVPPPFSLNAFSNNSICENDNGSINIVSIINGAAPYQYDFNNTGYSSVSTYSNLAQGVYTVVVKDAQGCLNSQIFLIDKTMANLTADITSNFAVCNGSDGSFVVNNITSGTPPYLTSLNNGTYSNNLNFNQLEVGTYSLNIRDANMCEANYVLTMEEAGDYTLYIPNTFTPNDNKVNDIWYVKATCLDEFNCSIFNRWGEKIKELVDINEGWDGTYKGNQVPDGVYFYVINAKTKMDDIKKSGHITVFR